MTVVSREDDATTTIDSLQIVETPDSIEYLLRVVRRLILYGNKIQMEDNEDSIYNTSMMSLRD